MRETSDHAAVTWMLPAWQTATFRQLLVMLVIASFLSVDLAQGDPAVSLSLSMDMAPAYDKFAGRGLGNRSPRLPRAGAKISLSLSQSCSLATCSSCDLGFLLCRAASAAPAPAEDLPSPQSAGAVSLLASEPDSQQREQSHQEGRGSGA